MTLKEFQKFMEDQHNAYWSSFWFDIKAENKKARLEENDLHEEINQLDYIGLSRGNESLMIELTVWAGDLKNSIDITCKMLGSNLDTCFSVLKDIINKVPTVYCGVNLK
jgi:hypothetical protein